MKINKPLYKSLGRKYLRLAALYRRTAPLEADFSEEALRACYLYESRGVQQYPVTILGMLMPSGEYNGYLWGKHWLDITVSSIVDGIGCGEITKYELYRSPQSWFWADKIRDIPVRIPTYSLV